MSSKTFWERREALYPHQITVDHMSEADLNPSGLYRAVDDFLRVPFDGKAHWGFKTAEGLKAFRKLIGATDE